MKKNTTSPLNNSQAATTSDKQAQVPFSSDSSTKQKEGSSVASRSHSKINKSRKTKTHPRKIIQHKNIIGAPTSAFSEYGQFRLREKNKFRQMDFLEGKCHFMKLSITKFSPTPEFK
jgi:hypothetical protein